VDALSLRPYFIKYFCQVSYIYTRTKLAKVYLFIVALNQVFRYYEVHLFQCCLFQIRHIWTFGRT